MQRGENEIRERKDAMVKERRKIKEEKKEKRKGHKNNEGKTRYRERKIRRK
jgi:hypothetical protein